MSKQSALLSAPTSSLLLEVVDGALVIQHWGAPLSGDLASAQSAIRPSIANSSWDVPQFPGIMRESSRGFLGRPTVSGHRNGKAWSTKFEVSNFHHVGNHVAITFTDFHAQLEVVITFDLDVHVYDPWANPQEIMREYGIGVVAENQLDLDEYSAVILAVAHNEYSKWKIETNANKVVFDVKSILPIEMVDGRL